jgi:hypothetical protein
MPAPDAAPAPPPPALRGEACSEQHACAEGMMCGPLPGGYCTSPCGVVGVTCDGACVETGRAGELCLKPCASDADCRTAEGYTCDAQWHACALPNFAAIVPKQCPGDGKRDPAFGDQQAASQGAAYQFEPAGALAADGGVAAMYITRGSIFEGNALGTLRVDAADKVALGELKTAKTSHFDPWLARDAKGTLYAVWYGFDGRDAAGQIAMATSTDGGATWSAPAVVHDAADCKPEDAGCLDKPMIAVGPPPADVVYVMYSAADAGLRVRASRDGGKTFGTTATALAGIYGNAVVGADGRLHIVTLNGGPMGAFGSAQQKVEYAVSADGGATFAKALTVSARDEVIPFFFSNPSIAVDDRRKWLYFAYARGGRDANWDIALAATKDGGKTWVRASLGDGCAIHMVPNLALDPTTGTLHVAYYDSQDAPGRFVHATCGAGLAKCTVAGAINSQPFAALSTVRHGAKWIGEYETLLVDDKRRVLHALWSQPVADGGKVAARIFHASAKLPKR